MACRIPMVLDAEYRGVAGEYEFKNDAGDQVHVAPKLKFEVLLPDGDVATLPVSRAQLDRATPAFDASSLKRGDRVTLGLLIIWKGGEPKGDSYLQVESCKRAAALKAA